MCYIMLVKRLGKPNEGIEKKIRDILKTKMKGNQHGFFLKNHGGEMRTLDEKKAEQVVEEMDLDSVMTHFRWASAGAISEDNVHGWEHNGWQIVHNGTISSYATGGRSQVETDSLLFFNDLMLMLNDIKPQKTKKVCRTIQKLCTEVDFSGRCALYNAKADKMYLFGDFKTYLYDNQYVIVSSMELYSWGESTISKGGFKFVSNSDPIAKVSIDGVGVIHNFSKDSWSYESLAKDLKFKNYKPANPSTTSSINKQSDSEILNKVFPDAEVLKENKLPVNLPISSDFALRLSSDQHINPDLLDLAEHIQEYYSSFPEERKLLNEHEVVGWNMEGQELIAWGGLLHDLYSNCCNESPATCLYPNSPNYFPLINTKKETVDKNKQTELLLPGKTYNLKELIEKKTLALADDKK